MRRISLWAAIALTALCQVAAADQVVARIKVQNPAAEPMQDVIVRGTLPVPADFALPVETLKLTDGGRLLPTQVAVFATYPGGDARFPVGRPEVVQLAARVSLPAGGFKEFDVAQVTPAPKPVAVIPFKDQMDAWLDGAAPVCVEATDCFGNRYAAEPLAKAARIETRQDGPLLREEVYQSFLRPVGQAAVDKPAVSQFMVVRAYLTRYSTEGFASLALMIHNGSIEHPHGDLFYRDIRLGVAKPMGMAVWQKRFSPASGAEPVEDEKYTWQSCPPAAADGKVFVMPARGAAVLRLTVFRPEGRERATRFAANQPIFVPVPSRTQWSWSNFQTARFGAGKYPMPLDLGPNGQSETLRLADRQLGSPTLGGELAPLQQAMKGTLRLGHAMPAGVRYGGMTGGEGIYYVDGVAAAVTGLNHAIHLQTILADRAWDRHHAHRFHDDGRPLLYHRFVVEADGRRMLDVPLDRRGFAADLPPDPAAAAQAEFVKANNLLSAEGAELLRYMNHDDQHLVRVYDTVPAAYLACDPVSRDRLMTLSTQACLKFNIYPFKSSPKTGGWGSLFNFRRQVDAAPGKGVFMGRAHGWISASLCWAFYLSQDAKIRQDALDVAAQYVEINRKAQMPCGSITVHPPYSKVFDGQWTYANIWQSVGIMGHGARAVVRMLSDPAHQTLADAMADAYARQGKWAITKAWHEDIHSPAANAGFQKKGTTEWLDPPYLGEKSGGGTSFYIGSPYVWYYEVTGDRQFIDRLNESAGARGLAAASARNLGNWSYALWFAQGGTIPGRDPFGK